jgi:hypothetical protein
MIAIINHEINSHICIYAQQNHLSLKFFTSFTTEVSLEVERLIVNPARTALDVRRLSR